ncbi:dioxygenase [Microbacterium lacus]|uniref:dioxygenase n=1 Tax=Microbacterium lacus TaxID=415217 RepID=UPI00384FEC06
MPWEEGGPVTTGGKDRGSREARERARVYQARQAFHDGRQRRRVRDNLIAAIAGGAVILAIVIAQTVYFTAGPGAPSPTPTTSSTPTLSPTPTVSETPSPEPSASE